MSQPSATLRLPGRTFRELVSDRNRAAFLLFECIWGFGMPFVLVTTIFPGYLAELHVSKTWIGLIPALQPTIIALTQPLSAYVIRPGARRVRQVRLAYVLGAVSLILFGLYACGGGTSPLLGLLASLFAVVGFSTGIGFGDPHYFTIVTESVSPTNRGSYFGLRSVCVGVGGIMGGACAAYLLDSIEGPAAFGWCVMAGGVTYIVATSALFAYRPGPHREDEAPANFGLFVRERLIPLLHQPRYAWFLVSYMCFVVIISGFSFLSLLVKKQLHASADIMGQLGALQMVCLLVLSPILGFACDHWGTRRCLVVSLLLYTLGVMGCLFFDNHHVVRLAYALAAIQLPVEIIVLTHLAFEIMHDTPPAEIIASKMLAAAPLRLVGPILVGAGIDRWSYTAPMLACVGFTIPAVVALYLSTRAGQPRRESRLPIMVE